MKSLSYIVLSAVVAFAALKSEARSIARYSRVSEMQVIKADGIFSNVRRAFLGEFAFGGEPGRYQASTYNLSLDGKNIGLRVKEVRAIGCGSNELVLEQQVMPGERLSTVITMKLVDHTTRTCENYIPFVWEAEVVSTPLAHHLPVSYLIIKGNPAAPSL